MLPYWKRKKKVVSPFILLSLADIVGTAVQCEYYQIQALKLSREKKLETSLLICEERTRIIQDIDACG